MDKDISKDTTNLQNIEMNTSSVKNTKNLIFKNKLNMSPQIDEIRNHNSRTLPTNSPKPNQVQIYFILSDNKSRETHMGIIQY